MPNIEFLTERRFTLSTHLIEVATKKKLSLTEFLLLMYFEDTADKIFDVNSICQVLSLKEEELLEAFNHLLMLNLIQLESCKDYSNKHCEKISLKPFYQVVFEKQEKKEKNLKKESVFDIYQKELGRSISPMEYEYINAWLEKGYTDELVIGALEEAVYNGVSSFRYIDSILASWQKKGYRTMTEVKEGLKRKEKSNNLELFDYNWLEDEG